MAKIIPYQAHWQDELIILWQVCGLTRPWNDPQKDIVRKLTDTQGQLLLLIDDKSVSALAQPKSLLGSVMVGYDGHRGSINYLAVAPGQQNEGYGRLLMHYCEQWLLEQGCPKINLCVRDTNVDVLAFYQAIGYQQDPVLLLSKRLIDDDA